MQTKTKVEQWPHIPDEAMHLADDCQISRSLRSHGHTVKSVGKLLVAHHQDTGAFVAWTPTPDGSPHRLSYRAQIVRALVRLAFFAAALGILAWALG